MVRFKDIRLIALDLDDTTLCSDGSLADKTREAIEAAISSGIEVVIASGRAFNSLPRAVAEICGIRYAITSNGAAVAKNPGGERIVSLTLHPDTVQDILELFGNELLECFIDGQAYCDARYMADPMRFGCSPAYVEYVKTTRLPVGDIGILSSLDPVALDQACLDLVYASDDPGKGDLIKRIESRNGVHTIEAAAALGVGSREYELITL